MLTTLSVILKRDSFHRKTEGQLGDILLDIIPLLGLYREYMENFNRSMAAINTWTQKNPLFAALIEEVEVTE